MFPYGTIIQVDTRKMFIEELFHKFLNSGQTLESFLRAVPYIKSRIKANSGVQTGARKLSS